MTALEIILLIAGVLCVVVSFLVNDGSSENSNTGDEQLKELTEQDKERLRRQIDEILEEKISNISEKTEAQLDKISNTKILEMNDYAETIMGEINRNHNETVFLYDMLNEKAKEVKSTVKDVNIAKREVAKMQYESTITTEEANIEEQKGVKPENRKLESKNPENRKSAAVYGNGNPTGAQANGIIASGAKLQQASNTDAAARRSAGTGFSHNGHSKDLAKERLIELVRKSTENSKELQRTAQLKVEPLKAAPAPKPEATAKEAKPAVKAAAPKAAESEKAEKVAAPKAVEKEETGKTVASKVAEKEETVKTAGSKVSEKEVTGKPAAQKVTESSEAAGRIEAPKDTESKKAEKDTDSKPVEKEATVKTVALKAVESEKAEKAEKATAPKISESEKAVKPKTTRKKTAKKTTEAESVEQNQPEDINVNIQFDKSVSKNEAIIDMYKQGMSNKEIAKQLNLGIGEVKLVIDLFKNTK